MDNESAFPCLGLSTDDEGTAVFCLTCSQEWDFYGDKPECPKVQKETKMDLGNMLAEALRDGSSEDAVRGGGAVLPLSSDARALCNGVFDLTAAAEAFLIKVRERDAARLEEAWGSPPNRDKVE